MKEIKTNGIYYLEPLSGTREWYWGSDYTHGDLYEAEKLFYMNHPVKSNRLIFVHYPDGNMVEPVEAKEGCYFGSPIFYNGKIKFIRVNFPKGIIEILQYEDAKNKVSRVALIPLSEVADCYNLLLHIKPLMLTRQPGDHMFQIIWPEKVAFEVGATESFCGRVDDKLYFSAWYEDPDYREEIIIRKFPSGQIIERISGSVMDMPDNQFWKLI